MSYPNARVIDLTQDDTGGTQVSPEQGIGGQVNLLRPAEIERLETEQYLNDRIINNTLQLYQQQFHRMNYLNSFVMEYVNNPRLSTQTGSRRLQQIRNNRHSIWYIPVNHGATHWLFLRITIASRRIEQFDSLPASHSQDYTQKVCDLLNRKGNREWQGHQVETGRQHNSFDCGLYVLALILHQLSGKTEDPEGRPSRQKLLVMLQTRIIPQSLYQEPESPVRTPACELGRTLRVERGHSRNHNSRTRPKRLVQTTLNFNRASLNQSSEGIDPPGDKKNRERNFQQYGDPMAAKAANTIRIYSQNINGMNADTLEETLTSNLDAMLDREVDIVGWSETNLEWNSYPVHLRAQRTFKKQFLRGKWLTTTSAIPSETN